LEFVSLEMFIPEEKISEILNTSDIVDVISESVILKKSGMNFFGLCPFHSEKTPSFSVNANKQIFHCFGCSAGGNVLSYVMKYHGITFPEAAKMMARRANIVIESETLNPVETGTRNQNIPQQYEPIQPAVKTVWTRVTHKASGFYYK